MRNFIVKEARLSEKERRNLSILDAIRRGGEISRADISKTTDLNIVTISNYVGKYIKKKIVFETGLDISTGGRRPELLKMNRQYGYSVGVDLGSPHLTIDSVVAAVVMDMSGKIIATEKIKKEKESFEKLTERVLDLTDAVIEKSGISASEVKGIGVGIWGVIDRYRGMVRYAIENERIISYTGLLDQLETRFGVPTIIEHDATLAAFGERWSGIGAGSVAENLIFMCSDSSCGLVIKGELYYGATKSAGELNLNPPYPGEESTTDTCWSSYDYGCCLRSRGIDLGIPERIRDHIEKNPEEKSIALEMAGGDVNNISFNTVIKAADAGDEISKKVLEGAGSYLGVKVAFLINLFNPEVVIVGRGIEKSGDIFFSAVRTSVKKWGYEESVKVVKILPTSLGGDVVAAGAAALVYSGSFRKILIKNKYIQMFTYIKQLKFNGLRRRSTIMRKVLVSMLIVAVALSNFGCGGKKRNENEIVMWLVGSESQAKTIMELSKKFTDATGVKVVCQAISWSNAHSKYLTSIAGDVAPDIGTMGLTWGMEFGELGAMINLREAFPEDVAEIEKNIFPGILESTRYGEKMYGIPLDISEHIMYYRTDLVPNPPRTWEELLDVLKSLKAQGRGMVFDWSSLDWIGYSPFLWQAGGSYYNEDYTKVTLDSPEAAEALNFISQLYKEGVPRTKVPLEQAMRTGDYPLAISGNWKIISLTVGAPEIKGKWSIAMLPKGPSGKRTAFIGGRILGIFSKSKMKEVSWKFIKFLFQPENQMKIYEASLETEDSYLPPNMEAWKDLPMDKTFKEVLQQQAQDAKGPPPVLAWDASTRFINHAIQMVVLRNGDPAEELKKATRKMQKELDDSKE